MSAHVTSYLDAIAHLPSGATLTLTNVSWEEYEQLLQDLGEGSAVRVFYDHGWLEIVSPTGRHERSKDLIAYLVRAIADELEQDLESFGSTTFKEKELERLAYRLYHVLGDIAKRVDLETYGLFKAIELKEGKESCFNLKPWKNGDC